MKESYDLRPTEGNKKVEPPTGISLDSGLDVDIVAQNSRSSVSSLPGSGTSDVFVEYNENGEAMLLSAKHEHIRRKDFSAEARGTMDVSNYMDKVALLLDLDETNVEAILEVMLTQMLAAEEPKVSIDEVKRALFLDDIRQLSKTIQSTCETESGGIDYDQSWISCFCTLPNVKKRHVGIARLRHPTNLGRTSQEVRFIIIIISKTKEKGTKSEMEAARTFSTLFSDIDLRQNLLHIHKEEEFKQAIIDAMQKHATHHDRHLQRRISAHSSVFDEDAKEDGSSKWKCSVPFTGIINDLRGRLPLYLSDFKDGVWGRGVFPKTLACILYLYFACLLPAIAIGVLNDKNTDGFFDVKKGIYAQALGGLVYAIFGGQPLVILRTTVPISIYLKVIADISYTFGLKFEDFFCCVGLWCSFFVFIYAATGLSKIMKWSTRSTEEVFAMFISLAFIVDAFKNIVHEFEMYYHAEACHKDKHAKEPTADNSSQLPTTVMPVAPSMNATGISPTVDPYADICQRDSCLLYILLVFGTLWVGLFLYNFTHTPFLNSGKRQILADYSLPCAVVVMSFFGSFVFRHVHQKEFTSQPGGPEEIFWLIRMRSLSWTAVLGGAGLGFSLSLLFFMDHNISAAMVQSPTNKLKKPPSLHWDLMVVAILNAVMSLFGIPWVHGALPHSPLHVQALADTEDRVDQGHVHRIVVRVRETRISGIFSHVLMGLTILMIPYPLQWIPRSVLSGLFLIMAITALDHIQFFERIMLLFTEQSAYPPNHYVRSVPQRKVHLFTFFQLVQLAVLCGFGFAPIPYLKMCFPVLLMIMLPIRQALIPLAIEEKYLAAIDGHI